MNMKYRLDDLCEFITDGTHQTPEYCDKDGVIFLSSKDVTTRKIDWDNVKYIPKQLHEELYKRLSPRKNDVLLAKNGTTGVAALVDRDEVFDVYVSLAVLRPKKEMFAKYLLYAVNSPVAKRQFDVGLKGVGVPNLHLSVIRNTEIKVVDYKMQIDICNILDKVADIIDARQQQLTKLDELVKARFVEMFGDPETNPKGFKKVLLSDIAEYFNGLTYSPDNVNSDGTIVLRSSNIQNSQLDFADTVRVDCSIKEKLYVKDNDILMCSRNGSARLVGKVALIKNITEPMSFGAFMMIIRSKYYSYLMTYFQMEAFRRQISTGATTTINQITGNMLNKITLPLPDMSEAKQFAAFVEQVDKSKVAVQKALDEAQTLFDSLMQQYFG